MAITGRTAAWLNLAYRFGRHVAFRMPKQLLGGDAELRRFGDAVNAEGYLPLLPEERDALPATMQCINCGLCSLPCPTLRSAPASAWDEAWTFVAGPSRSIDRADTVAAGLTPCADCDDCAAACPTGVPIPHLAAVIRRLGGPTATVHRAAP
jgi:succinate dehydrogenase/fumarate reductase-like Fe-S protein